MSVTQKQSIEVEIDTDDMDDISQGVISHHSVGPIEVEDVQERIEEHREVFVLVGLTGAGKTTVADMIADEHPENVETYEMSDHVRSTYGDKSGDPMSGYVSDNDLGEWAAAKKNKHGRDYFARGLASDVHSPTTPHVVISGVRSPEEATAIADEFGDVTVVGVWTLPDTRYERKHGEPPLQADDDFVAFNERDERELWEWGCVEFFAEDSVHEADYIIPNHGTRQKLREHVQKFLRGQGQYDVNPFPHCDFERVAQYL